MKKASAGGVLKTPSRARVNRMRRVTAAPKTVRIAGSPNAGAAGVVIGIFVGINEAGQPLVDFSLNPHERAIVARSIPKLAGADANREVVLQFEHGDLGRPVVMGILQRSEAEASPEGERSVGAALTSKRLELTVEEELVLRCGAASITMTRAGKIIIRGAYIVSRSTGVNRVNGASVQIN